MLDVDLICVASLVGQRLCAPGFHYWRGFFTPEGGNRGKMFADSGLRGVKSFQTLPATGVGGVAAARQTWPDFSLFGPGLWTLDFGLLWAVVCWDILLSTA
jgi:hypothetical protein